MEPWRKLGEAGNADDGKSGNTQEGGENNHTGFHESLLKKT
jgi:hypothetical protein